MSELGQFADTYEIWGKLGEGSGGIVYKAYHKRLKKEVVLKKIRSRSSVSLNRRQEVDILKNLNHSFLPQVLDFLETENGVYTVMTYVPGKSFKKLLDEKYCFTEEQLNRWAMQLCSALNYLHSQKPPIIHSDIKPANIMLTPQGDICLIDFNIAFFLNEDVVMGYSNGYSSPEQYGAIQEYESDSKKQKRSIINEKSDIYSVGATFYHLAVGEKLPSDSRANRKLLISNTSEAFAQVIIKAVQKNPQYRFQSAHEMFQAFQKIPENNKQYRALRKRKRWKRTAVVSLIALLILLVGVGVHKFRLQQLKAYNNLVKKQIECQKSGDYEDAEYAYEQAIKILPSALESYYQNACMLYEQKKYSECIEFIDYDILQNEKIDKLQTRMTDVYYLKADCLFQMKEYQEARETYESLFQIGSKEPQYYRDYAITCAYVGDLKEAQRILEDAIDCGLTDDSVYYVKGEIDKSISAYDEAIIDFKNCIQSTEDNVLKARAYILISEIYEAKGERVKERELLLLAEQEVPTENQLHILESLIQLDIDLANNLGKNEYRKEAIEKLNKIINSGWDNFGTYNNLVILYEKIGELSTAESILKDMQELFGEDYRVYKRYAFLEIDKQEQVENRKRNYILFEEYYEKAKQLYEEQLTDNNTDQEMLLLDNVYEQIVEGGWLE